MGSWSLARSSPGTREQMSAHAEGFYFCLFICFNSRQEFKLRRSKLDFDRHGKTFGGWWTPMGTLVHFGPLWVPGPTEFPIWQVPQLLQSPMSLQSAPEQFFLFKCMGMEHCLERWSAPRQRPASEAHLEVKCVCADRDRTGALLLVQGWRDLLSKLPY